MRDSSPGGETGIYRCLDAAARQFSGIADVDRKRLVILMTDGQDTEGGSVNAIASAGVPVVAIGFGKATNADALQQIAERTGGSYFTSDDMVAALRQATGYR